MALLDIGLPIQDGYEVAQHLRALNAGNIRLVAKSGYGQPAYDQCSREADFLGHLTRSLDVGQVQVLLV